MIFTLPPRPCPPIHPAPTEQVLACPHCDFVGASGTVDKHIRQCQKYPNNSQLHAVSLPAVWFWPPITSLWLVVDLEAENPGHTDLQAMHKSLPKSPNLICMPHDFHKVSAFVHQTGWASYFDEEQPWTLASEMYDPEPYNSNLTGCSLSLLVGMCYRRDWPY